jgi:hypothetical protein
VEQDQPGLILIGQRQGIGQCTQRPGGEIRREEDALESHIVVCGWCHSGANRQHRARSLTKDSLRARAKHKFLQTVLAVCPKDDQINGMPLDDILDHIPKITPFKHSTAGGSPQRVAVQEPGEQFLGVASLAVQIERNWFHRHENGCGGRHRVGDENLRLVIP